MEVVTRHLNGRHETDIDDQSRRRKLKGEFPKVLGMADDSALSEGAPDHRHSNSQEPSGLQTLGMDAASAAFADVRFESGNEDDTG